MSSKYEDLFAALMAPFGEGEVRVRAQGGQQLSYITARTAMNRLDDVLGPESWWDDYSPGEHGVICRLTIRLPDGQELRKVDVGGYAGMKDEGDDDKSGFSDAFKRAAVKFGIGRYLYRDGVPAFAAHLHGQKPARTHQAVGRGNRTEPTREPQGEAPAGSEDAPGVGLFKWATKHDRLPTFTAWAKDNGIDGLIKKWDRETCERAWQACGGTK